MRLVRRYSALALAVTLLAAAFIGDPPAADAASRTCTSSPYAYAGLIGQRKVAGVRASITAVTAPDVRDGHVAGWVGVGGVDAGPSGQAEWIQVGLSGFSGGDSQLYYEITQPGKPTSYTPVVQDVQPGESFTVAVIETVGRPNTWHVEVNGRTVSRDVLLPGSHGRWEPTATSEAWNVGTGTCNAFAYRFSGVSAYHTARWRPLGTASVLSDRGYGLQARTNSSFVAKSL